MKYIFSIGILLFVAMSSFGQLDPKAYKAIKIFDAGKYEKGIKKMRKVVDANGSEAHWDLLVRMHELRYNKYQRDLNAMFSALFLSQKGGTSNLIKSLTAPSMALMDLLSVCREATLNAQSSQASMLLRNHLVDHNPDTALTAGARKAYNAGESHFRDKFYRSAIRKYREAIDSNADYYKAYLYLGDSYWYLEEIDSAILYFNKCIDMQPTLLEPKKYMVDALAFDKQNEAALNMAFQAIYIYPDISMFDKMKDIYDRDDKELNKHWMARPCKINTMLKTSVPTGNVVWKKYQDAKELIKSYCDDDGIVIQENSVTDEKYLEVFSWMHMLNNAENLTGELAFAKKMMAEGYLDCYVFISMFHHDMYAQYKDFSENNQERIAYFISNYLVK